MVDSKVLINVSTVSPSKPLFWRMPFFLILNNLAGFGITSLLTLLLLLMGKLAVVVVSCYFCYLWLNYDPVLSVKVASDIMPVIATGLIAFFVSNAFFEIVANTMDTVLLNYCVDLQRQESGRSQTSSCYPIQTLKTRPPTKVGPLGSRFHISEDCRNAFAHRW